MFDTKLKQIAKFLIKNNLTLSTAESCTGGLLSSRFTDISGSSSFIKSNFVTYANEAKEEILFVPHLVLEKNGAVSEECAYRMAEGLRKRTGCDIAVCTTGIAGPAGGSAKKPVGLMYMAVYYKDEVTVKKVLFPSFLPRKFMKYLFTQAAIAYLFEKIN